MIINLAAVLLHSNSPERWGVPGAASGSFFRLAIVSTLTAAPHATAHLAWVCKVSCATEGKKAKGWRRGIEEVGSGGEVVRF